MVNNEVLKTFTEFIDKHEEDCQLYAVYEDNNIYAALLTKENGELDDYVLFLNRQTKQISTKHVLTVMIEHTLDSMTEIYVDDSSTT